MRARPFCVPLLASAAFLMLALGVPHQAQAGDPAAGEAVFRSQCGICHSPKPDRNMIGPTLFGVVGRTTGAVPGYAFSVSNKNSNITWTPEVLDKYPELAEGRHTRNENALRGAQGPSQAGRSDRLPSEL